MLNPSLFPQSSEPVELTEAETEYAINVVKHIYSSHVVLQYNCTNTIPEQLLENVSSKQLSTIKYVLGGTAVNSH
jgi:hypothetical protein